jgi:HlyD family secretion protein
MQPHQRQEERVMRSTALLAIMVGIVPALGAEFQTAQVKRGTITLAVRASGTLEPENPVEVGAQVTGVVEKLEVDYGQRVEKGAVLARLDQRPFQLRVEAAQALLERAKAELQLAEVQRQAAQEAYGRVRAAQEKGAASAEDVQARKTQAEVAAAQVLIRKADVQAAAVEVRKAQADLDYTVIRAPIQGIVIDRRVNLGQTVAAKLDAPSLFLLAPDLLRLEIWVAVPERDIGLIQRGTPASFSVDALRGKVFTGKVKEVRANATLAQGRVTYTVVVRAAAPEEALLPYMTADVRFDVGKHEDVLLVPTAALRWRPLPEQVVPQSREAYKEWRYQDRDRELKQNGLVWALEKSGLVRPVAVWLGASDGRVTEVTGEGLTEGLTIVVGLAGIPLFPDR